jgi:hypothetical protein
MPWDSWSAIRGRDTRCAAGSGAGTCTGKVEATESKYSVPMSSSHELVAKFE